MIYYVPVIHAMITLNGTVLRVAVGLLAGASAQGMGFYLPEKVHRWDFFLWISFTKFQINLTSEI